MNSFYLLILLLFSNSVKEKQAQFKPYNNISTLTINTVDTVKLKEFLLGKFDYKKDNRFSLVQRSHLSKYKLVELSRSPERTVHLQKDVYKAFVKMHEAAKAEGIELKIISGTRSFYEQKAIWERKWKKYEKSGMKNRTAIALKVLLYSSMPMASRHHWGTDMDINNLENKYFESGKGLKEYQWLVKNAHKYGFYQVYDDKKLENRKGYEMEKWHWTYLPLSSVYLQQYNKRVSYKDIKGFMGSELSVEIDVIKNYVNGIPNTIKSTKYTASVAANP